MAANSLVLGVEIIGEFKKLTAATTGAQSSLNGLNKKTAAISRSMNRALGAIGLGFSLRVITNELEQAGKAAAEDAKSMKLLEIGMINTGKATEENVKQAEAYIKKMQFTAAIADDELRPAYQKLFTATGNVTEANRLLTIAADAAAYSGKDLSAVSQAMAKSLAGSDTALVRLIPSLKGVNDPMGELERLTKGAAEAAANLDPYQRMQVIFGELQEQIGMALMPKLQEFSTWLATPEGQDKMQKLADLAVLVITKFGELAQWVVDNKNWLVPMVTAIGAVTTAFKVATVAAEAFKTATIIGAAIGGSAAGVAGAVGAGAAIGGFQQGQQTAQNAKIYGQGFAQLKAQYNKPKAGTTVNVNVKNVTDAKTIIDTVKRFTNSSGTSLGRALMQ